VIAGLTAALLAAASTVALGRDHPPRANAGPPGPCALARNTGESVQDFSARLITCAAETWSVPGGADRAICIARRESGLIPHAKSPNGQYLGLFQHSAKYWPSRYDQWTKPDWQLRTSALNGRTNAVVTIRMVHGIGRWVTAGWPAKGC
jgi:broad specificity phosphatase PhoE